MCTEPGNHKDPLMDHLVDQWARYHDADLPDGLKPTAPAMELARRAAVHAASHGLQQALESSHAIAPPIAAALADLLMVYIEGGRIPHLTLVY